MCLSGDSIPSSTYKGISSTLLEKIRNAKRKAGGIKEQGKERKREGREKEREGGRKRENREEGRRKGGYEEKKSKF